MGTFVWLVVGGEASMCAGCEHVNLGNILLAIMFVAFIAEVV